MKNCPSRLWALVLTWGHGRLQGLLRCSLPAPCEQSEPIDLLLNLYNSFVRVFVCFVKLPSSLMGFLSQILCDLFRAVRNGPQRRDVLIRESFKDTEGAASCLAHCMALKVKVHEGPILRDVVGGHPRLDTLDVLSVSDQVGVQQVLVAEHRQPNRTLQPTSSHQRYP